MDNIRLLTGERIRILRKERGWSQEELGERADLHHTYVGAVERGEKNASIDTLDKIAEALGVEMIDLFTLARKQQSIDSLRSHVIEEIRELSSGTLKLIADLIKALKTGEATVSRKTRRQIKKKV
ncbi:MAG: HTH-type transcriptional regulator SinR [Syntrophorhabdaceae bacterium PtaU1.Bin034]|jgi:transcriptional regulator with XRE-family HTH domain|nr:MAG: HTH-type transcriptional regulator SinR [Syntrophorhabdaceae bacterium PtaU1.Bin034]